MIFNLLTDLVDPDNISDGEIPAYDTTQIWIAVIFLLGIAVTIAATIIIFKLYQKLQIPKRKAIYYAIVITAIVVIVLFTAFSIQACESYAETWNSLISIKRTV